MLKKFLLLFTLCLLVTYCHARFGGGGGGYHGGGGGGYHSSGGGYHSYGGGYHSSGGSYDGPVHPFLIFLGVLALVGVLAASVYYEKEKEDDSIYSSLPSIRKGFMTFDEKSKVLSKIKDFNQKEFLDKAESAFKQMQDSWMKKNVSTIRRFISDGMYQRVHAQVLMMNKLGQTNQIDAIRLQNASIVYAEQKEPFEIIYVEFKAFIDEKYSHPVFKALNHGYYENFTEYWAFVRKTNRNKNSDLYSSNACPNCGSPLSDNMGEVSKCSSCQAYTNTGEFDWVISEVIQPDEFSRMVEAKKYYNSITTTIKNIQPVFPGLNIPVLEDKASNAFLQIKIASALCEPKRISRFSTGEFLENFLRKGSSPFLYNRLFLHKATLINIFDDGDHYFAAFNIKYTGQKVRIENDKLDLLDRSLVTAEEYLVLTIRKENKMGAHSVFSYSCSNCGGTLNDTVDLNCPYCNSILNDDSRDWIVSGLYNYQEFTKLKTGFRHSPRITKEVEEKISGKPLQLRDYALNNMMVILNADGQLTTDEKKFAIRMAKILKYDQVGIASLWENCDTGKLGIQMPADKKHQQKVYDLMKKAAKVNNNICSEEKLVLDEVKAKYQLQD